MRRVFEHKPKFVAGFRKKYNVIKLVYCESNTTALKMRFSARND